MPMKLIQFFLIVIFTLTLSATLTESQNSKSNSSNIIIDNKSESTLNDSMKLTDQQYRLKMRMEAENNYVNPYKQNNDIIVDNAQNELKKRMDEENNILKLDSENSEVDSDQRESKVKILSIMIGVFIILFIK